MMIPGPGTIQVRLKFNTTFSQRTSMRLVVNFALRKYSQVALSHYSFRSHETRKIVCIGTCFMNFTPKSSTESLGKASDSNLNVQSMPSECLHPLTTKITSANSAENKCDQGM